MPLYVGDYLGDTQRLTTEQHGAYLLLILDYWRNGPAPNDDAVLQCITKLDKESWNKHRPSLERLFNTADGHWTHKRIDAELEKAKTNHERRSSKALKAAQARWGNAQSNATGIPQAMPVECPSPSPSSSPKGSEEASDAKASSVHARKGTRLPEDFEMPGDWIAWAQKEKPDWCGADFVSEVESFCDFWHAKAGKDGAKLDWLATWRNWVRNSRRVTGGGWNNGGFPPGHSGIPI